MQRVFGQGLWIVVGCRAFLAARSHIDGCVHFALETHLRYPNVFLNVLNVVDLPFEQTVLQ